MADGDQRLNAVLMALVNAVVEGQSCLVGLSVIAVGQDAVHAMDSRKHLKPISANRAISSL